MEFLAEYGMFLAKVLTLVVSLLFVVGSIVSMGHRQRGDHVGHIEVVHLNEKYKVMGDAIREAILSVADFKKLRKKDKKSEKSKAKSDKKVAKERAEGHATIDKRVFVLHFDGDIKASATESLREEISAVLKLANSGDEVVLCLESGGGMVHSYGLASSQLRRIIDAGVPLTIAVDKVAASGGYMMACVANKIIAAPFAMIGSIGVLAQIPNFHRLLKDNKVDFELLTAGEHKRTLTMFGENTDQGREKFVEELEDTHLLFKSFVSEHRPQIDINAVATGEVWFGERALNKQLVDELKTSDAYIAAAIDEAEVYEISYVHKKNWQERFGVSIEAAMERVGLKLWQQLVDRPKW
ncbi:MAG: serine protease SohB [Halieaceae bacterium]